MKILKNGKPLIKFADFDGSGIVGQSKASISTPYYYPYYIRHNRGIKQSSDIFALALTMIMVLDINTGTKIAKLNKNLRNKKSNSKKLAEEFKRKTQEFLIKSHLHIDLQTLFMDMLTREIQAANVEAYLTTSKKWLNHCNPYCV
jgi:hypothetical protein